jgi:hypothetical protein
MLSDLEPKEAMNRGNRLGVMGSNAHLRATLSALGVVCYFAFQSLHRLHTRRRGSMNEHRDDKIALGKPARDHRQVTTNSVLGSGIRGLVALDLDGVERMFTADEVCSVVDLAKLKELKAPDRPPLSLRK